MLPRERRKVATLDWDSSIHEVYQKKEGADFAYTVELIGNVPGLQSAYGTTAAERCALSLAPTESHPVPAEGSRQAAQEPASADEAVSAGDELERT